MSKNLLIYAGKEAFSQIQEKGLDPESIAVIAGAAGGPKWLILDGLDRAIFFNWLKSSMGQNQIIHLVGASIGAWRFAAICQDDGKGSDKVAHDILRDAYIRQSYTAYPSGPTALDVTNEGIKILDAYLGNGGINRILTNKHMRLSVLTNRSSGPFVYDTKYLLTLSMVLCGIANTLSRSSLKLFFSRTLFHDPRDLPPFLNIYDTVPTEKIHLTANNLQMAILASGSIPVVMEGVDKIPDTPPGTYFDGGIVDYHVNIPFGPFAPFENPDRKIVLFPHYLHRIIPGWFDKLYPFKKSFRKPNSESQKNVLMLCPSPEFVERLPYGKLPDRKDFRRFKDDEGGRIKYWEKVARESQILGDEFLEIIEKDNIRDIVRPF